MPPRRRSETDPALLQRATRSHRRDFAALADGRQWPRAGSRSIRSRWTRNARRRERRWRCTRSTRPRLITAVVLSNSPRGADAEFADLETELVGNDNVFGARQLADRLAASFPASAGGAADAGIRRPARGRSGRGGAQLRGALALPGGGAQAGNQSAHRELTQTLCARANLAGDAEEPLAQAQAHARARRHARQSPRLCAAADDGAARCGGDAAIGGLGAQLRVRRRWRCACWDCSSFNRGTSMRRRRNSRELLSDRTNYLDDAFYYLGVDRGSPRRSGARAALVRAGAERRQRGAGVAARRRDPAETRRARRQPTNCSIGSSRMSRSVHRRF